MTILMEIQLEIRKLETKNNLLGYHKTRFDSKLVIRDFFDNVSQSE